MADLEVSLLGPPEIRWEGQLLNVKRRIPRTMLLYLASHENFVGRGTLLTTFWEDAPADFARRRLREALSRIRADIPDPSVLTVHSDLVGLDPTKIYVDHRQFLNLLDSISNQPWTVPLGNPLPQPLFQTINRAANLWHGSQFLEGFDLPDSRPIEDWSRQTNQQLTHLRTRLFMRLSDHYQASGQIEEALDCAYKALENDNLNEDLHARVIRLLMIMEHYQEARQYYSFVIKLFNDELSSQPTLQLISLYRQIQIESLATIQVSRPDWRILTSIHTPYVGHQAEFTQLEEAFVNGGCVSVSGESGLGKSRLVQEFCEQYASDRRILVTPCRLAESNLPFQPIIELLRNQIHASEWRELSKIWIEPLTILLPELISDYQSVDKPILTYDADNYRSSLFEALRQLFHLITLKKDLIVFFDDVQWADEATLSTIAYLLERPPFNKRALIILAARSEDYNPSLEKFYSSLRNSTRLKIISLERLSLQDISTLSRYVLGYPINQEVIEQLSHESGGNPFILLETLRALQEKDARSTITSHPSFPMTKSVYSLIQNRIDRLSPLARETSEFAAVIGTEFDPDLICLASQQNLSIVARGIEELKQRNLLETTNHPPHNISYRFIHEKIRETIILETNPVRFRFLHEKIAQALESRVDSQPQSQAAVLAQHYESAGKISTAIKYWLQAGQWARQLYSTAEAHQIFSHAEQLIPHSNANLADELIHGLYVEWTEMAFELQNGGSIRDQNNNLLKIGRKRNSPLLIGTALDGLSNSCMVENKFEEGLVFTNQALNYLNQTDNTFEKMNNHIHRGVFLYMLGRFNEAIQSFEMALTLCDQDGDPQIQRATANAHYQLALTKTLSGWPESGLKHANLSMDLANKLEHHHIVITAYTASSLAYYFMADYSKSRQDNNKGIEIAKRLKADRMLGYLFAIQGFLNNASGDLGAAYESAQLVSKLGEEYNYDDLLSISCRLVGDIFLLIEAPSKACEYFQQGVQYGGHDFWGLDNLIRLGYAQIRNVHTTIGMDNLKKGIDAAQSSGLGIIEILGIQFLCYAYIYLEEWELVRQTAYSLEREARKRSLSLVQVMSQISRGISESKIGNKYDSIEQLQLTVDAVAEIDQPFIELRTLIRLIKTKQAGGYDTDQDTQRVYEILDHIELNAQPDNLHQAVLDFRKKQINIISV
jgi:DNA-binding SARP family transcriptional activator